MCEAWVYWVIFEKEGKNKQTIQVPLLYPCCAHTRESLEGRDEEAYLRTKTDLTEVNAQPSPSDLIFLRSRLS